MEGQTTNPSVTPQFKQTSADDLLEHYEQEGKTATEEVTQEAEKQAKIELEVPKQIAAEQIVKKLEAKEEAKAEEPPPAPPAEEEFAYKANKPSGEEITIPADISFTHDYENGKQVKFTVDDAINAYVERDTFNRTAQERASNIGRREKALETEVQQIVHNARHVTEQFMQGNVFEALSALARMAGKNAGMDPVELQIQAIESATKVAETWRNLSPEQKELFKERQKAAEYKRAFERQNQSAQRTEQQRQLEAHVSNLSRELGVTQEGFLDAYGELLELVGPQGKFRSPEEIQPEHVQHYVRFSQNRTKIGKLADEVAQGLSQNYDFIDEVSFMLANDPSMSDNDIKDVIRYVSNKQSPAVESLNRKVQATQAAGLRTQLSEASSPKKQEDSLEEELYKEFFGNRRLSGR